MFLTQLYIISILFFSTYTRKTFVFVLLLSIYQELTVSWQKIINIGKEKKIILKVINIILYRKIMMIMIMVVINNNKNNRLTFGSPRATWILAAGLMFVTGFWLPVEEVLIYSHKAKSPAPWGPCGPIGPWKPLNPWGPIAPWDPLNPWGPAGPIGPWEPFTPGGPTGPGSLLTFSTWKENKCSGPGSWKAD